MSKNSNASPALFVVRHGDTAANDPNDERFRSWNNSIGLTVQGKEHAKAAAETLAARGVVFLVASDLKRARQTAAIIGDTLGLEPVHDPALRDWDLGVYINQPVKEFLSHVKRFEERMPDTPIPDGEAYTTFHRRFSRALFRYLHAVETMGVNGALVTHQRCIYTIPNILTNGGAAVKWGGPPKPGGVVRVAPGSQAVVPVT